MESQNSDTSLENSGPRIFDLSNENHEGHVIKRDVRSGGLVVGILGPGFLGFLFLLAGVPQGPTWIPALEVIFPLGGQCMLVIAISARAPPPGVRDIRFGSHGLSLCLDHGQLVTLRWSDPSFDLTIKDFAPPHVWRGATIVWTALLGPIGSLR
jgi:hypothetical protein